VSDSEFDRLKARIHGIWMRPAALVEFAAEIRDAALTPRQLSILLDLVPALRTGSTGAACAKLHDIVARALDERTALQSREVVAERELIKEVETQLSLMIAVSTGGPRIDDVNEEYRSRGRRIGERLAALGLEDPNPYGDLWEWYGKWSSGDLPTYQSRRQYLNELYRPLIKALGSPPGGLKRIVQPTGWARVDRNLEKVFGALEEARHEEDFQVIGLLSREVLISLAQAVYKPGVHQPADGTTPSESDAKRQLEAFIACELPGKSNEVLRRYAKACLRLALELQHRRTAPFRQAALCAEAARAMVNMIAIVAGRRDPK
jgi:hypothetical protein